MGRRVHGYGVQVTDVSLDTKWKVFSVSPSWHYITGNPDQAIDQNGSICRWDQNRESPGRMERDQVRTEWVLDSQERRVWLKICCDYEWLYQEWPINKYPWIMDDFKINLTYHVIIVVVINHILLVHFALVSYIWLESVVVCSVKQVILEARKQKFTVVFNFNGLVPHLCARVEVALYIQYIVFKHPVALLYIIHSNTVLSQCNYLLFFTFTLPFTTCFSLNRPSSGVLSC
jgi:hypothetical protein